MPADALPSLFRWEPGMHAWWGERSCLVCIVHENGVLRVMRDGSMWTAEPREVSPDMSHAGTRGLVLEQVRAVTGKRHACSHVDIEDDENLDVIACEIRSPLRYGSELLGEGRGRDLAEAEGAALLDALHRAEKRGG